MTSQSKFTELFSHNACLNFSDVIKDHGIDYAIAVLKAYTTDAQRKELSEKLMADYDKHNIERKNQE